MIQCTNAAELSWGRTLWSSQFSPGEWTIDQFVAEQASGSDPWQNITSQHPGEVPNFAVHAESLNDPKPPSEDLNGDGIVDGADLGALLGQWGGAGTADLDHSGAVDAADVGLLLAAWTTS